MGTLVVLLTNRKYFFLNNMAERVCNVSEVKNVNNATSCANDLIFWNQMGITIVLTQMTNSLL